MYHQPIILFLFVITAIHLISICGQCGISVSSYSNRYFRQNQNKKVRDQRDTNVTINIHLNNPPANPVTPVVGRPVNPCASNVARRSCDQCIHSSNLCYWCNYDNTCRNLPAGQSQPFRGDCGNDAWHVDQCIMTGNVLPIVIPVTACVAALAAICLLFCMCCRYRSKRHVDRQLRQIRQQRDPELKKKKNKTAERAYKLEVVRQKYTGKSDPKAATYSWENSSNHQSKLFKFNPFKYHRLDDANNNTITAV